MRPYRFSWKPRSRNMTPTERERVSKVFASLVALVVLGVGYWRLYYGVDLTDESFYVAVPWRLAHGARPFVDEAAVAQQLAAVLLYPFVWAYGSLVGVGGVVLFLRHLQFLFSLAVLVAVVVGLRPVLATPRALLVGLAAVAFVPFQIHSLSYDTLGGGLFTAGCLLGFGSLREPQRRRLRLLAGVCHGLAVFVYPPLVAAVAVCYLIRLRLAHRRARRETLAIDLPALALPLAGLAALVAGVGVDRFRSDYRQSRTTSLQHWDAHKLVTVAAHEWHTLRFSYLLFSALAVAALLWTRRREAARLVLLVLPFCMLPPRLGAVTASLEYVAHYGWLALPLLPLVRHRSGAGQLFAACWLPALVAGLATGYTSSNGGVNVGVGFFPAAIVSSTFLIWALEPASAGERRALAVAPVLVTLCFLLVFEAVPVYRDGPISTLDARVESGAFAGLLTNGRKQAFLARLHADVGALVPSCRILFFDDFPAGYLLTRARADTTSVWVHGRSREELLLRSYGRRRFPDVVVELRRIPYTETTQRSERYRSTQPLLRMLRAHGYRLVVRRADYLVYRRRSPACRTRSR